MAEIIFPDRESRLLEFKSRVTDFLPLIKTSIAFANAAGGRIIRRDIIRTEEITGSIIQQSNISMNLLEAWLATDYKLHGAQLKGQLPVPETAIREAILNALLHCH